MAKQKNHFEKVIFVGILIVLLLGIWIKPHVWAVSVSGTVTEKNHKNDVYKILVRLDNKDFVETFENSDVPLRLKFNSGDIQANVEVGQHYKFNVIGRRNYYLSAYRKIVSFQKDPK